MNKQFIAQHKLTAQWFNGRGFAGPAITDAKIVPGFDEGEVARHFAFIFAVEPINVRVIRLNDAAITRLALA